MRRAFTRLTPHGGPSDPSRHLDSSRLNSCRSTVCLGRARAASTKAAPSKSYASTLLLPKTKFKLWPDYVSRDKEFSKRTSENLYDWQRSNNEGPAFVLHDGPPYANGALHMGHSLNKILKDIINRFQVLRGKRVNYVPGWDCHGLPIETKTLEQLNVAPNTLPAAEVRKHAEKFARKQVKSQMAEFQKLSIMTSWDDANTYRTIDRGYEIRQLRLLQELVRKNLIYRRHRPVFWSPSSVSALAEAEVQYVDDHTARSAYISFPVTTASEHDTTGPQLRNVIHQHAREGEEVAFLIWTTTPWTIPANMGIAVNVDMEYSVVRSQSDVSGRPSTLFIVGSELLETVQSVIGDSELLATVPGSDLVGTTYVNKTFNSPFPLRVLPSKHVTSTSGTGVVHMAPAHGAEDYAAFLAQGLLDDPSKSVVCPVNDAGQYSFEIQSLAKTPDHAERLAGKEVLGKGTDEVLAILKESGALLAEHRYKHRYPYDSRTNKPMIIRATSQWFANVGEIKQPALEALSDVTFHPPSARSRLEAFVRERSEWCISRQRVWGSPIPSLHDTETGEAVLTAESMDHILTILEQKGPSYWWIGAVEEFVPPSLRDSGRTFVKGTDTIDVWFDSGSSWTMLDSIMGEESNRPQSETPGLRVRQADVCLEGSDQHRGWFQSLLLTAVGSTKDGEKVQAPFKHLISHGFVLDESGKKMSKSVGNIITPATIISGGKDLKKEPAYGVDVLRLWAAGVDYTKDVSVGPTSLAQVAESVRKLRNTARFMLGNLGDGERLDAVASKEEMTLIDRYVMHELYMLEKKTLEGYENFNIHSVVQSLTTFSNSILSALYFDVTKDVLYTEGVNSPVRRGVVTVLEKTLDVYTAILAPVLPQLAEEIVEHGKKTTDAQKSVFESGWKSVDQSWHDPSVASDMGLLLQVRDRALQLLETARRDGRIRSALESVVDIELEEETGNAEAQRLSKLVISHREELKALFIVSDVSIHTPDSSQTSAEWEYSAELQGIKLFVRPSTHHKCPRCWQYTAPQEDTLCVRCDSVVHS